MVEHTRDGSLIAVQGERGASSTKNQALHMHEERYIDLKKPLNLSMPLLWQCMEESTLTAPSSRQKHPNECDFLCSPFLTS
jgi:hypothetical protein